MLLFHAQVFACLEKRQSIICCIRFCNGLQLPCQGFITRVLQLYKAEPIKFKKIIIYVSNLLNHYRRKALHKFSSDGHVNARRIKSPTPRSWLPEWLSPADSSGSLEFMLICCSSLRYNKVKNECTVLQAFDSSKNSKLQQFSTTSQKFDYSFD